MHRLTDNELTLLLECVKNQREIFEANCQAQGISKTFSVHRRLQYNALIARVLATCEARKIFLRTEALCSPEYLQGRKRHNEGEIES